MSLTLNEFPRFFQAVNGYAPFPWQTRLVYEIVEHRGGCWPPVLGLPTSAGKTSVLDVAVFVLALEVMDGKPKSVSERRAAVRTFFVVDRRIVVDEAGAKARRLARLLHEPPADAGPELREVARRLSAFSGARPLHVAVLRGGMYRDESWAEAPNQPTICLSTVDQVGSRLLFRGYGVSKKQYAVHAGLVGNDSLILVDEAHLSRPFLETLKAVDYYRGERWAEQTIHTPFQTVFMSATVEDAAEPVILTPADAIHAARGRKFGLGDDAHGNDFEHPLLKPRLQAQKLARLEEDKGEDDDKEKNRQQFAAKLAGYANDLAGLGMKAEPPKKGRGKKAASDEPTAPPVQIVGVVVNRVDTARRVFDLLTVGRNEEAPAYDVILLTGRIRPYDRDELLFRKPLGEHRGWFPFIEAKGNAEHTNYGRPPPPHGVLFVVATQTIEVGANISFDALVTEAAPLDALRQRFGRLDRLGFRKLSHAVIVTRKDLLNEDDPVYGAAIKATWAWLKEREKERGKKKRIDFGITSLSDRLPTDPETLAALCAETAHAPIMLPAHLDTWVQTTVPPVPDPDPALFLHGPRTGPADVSVVWRADLTPDILHDDDAAIDIVSLVLPTSMEALPVPVWAVKCWLKDEASSALSDVESAREPDDGSRHKGHGKPCLRWCGPDDRDTQVISPKEIEEKIQPGDTIVVPSGYGGADEYGWKPSEKERPVVDVADDCSWRAKRKPLLRIRKSLTQGTEEVWVHHYAMAAWASLTPPFPPALSDAVGSLATATDLETGEPDWDAVARAFEPLTYPFNWLATPRPQMIPYPAPRGQEPPGIVLVAKKRVVHPDDPNADSAVEGPTSGDNSWKSGVAIALARHCEGVRIMVGRFNERLQLPRDLTRLLDRAALLHDAGKADPRFQLWMHGGNEAAAARAGDALLAKSGLDGRNRAADRAARRRARWPQGARHEALSVCMVRATTDALAGANDPDLLLYLIGTHHGHGRPLWSMALDDDLPADTDPARDTPRDVTCRLGDVDLRSEGVFRPEAGLGPVHVGWVDRFWQLVSRYGYWGLAYLETLLILADHRQSELEQEEPEQEGNRP